MAGHSRPGRDFLKGQYCLPYVFHFQTKSRTFCYVMRRFILSSIVSGWCGYRRSRTIYFIYILLLSDIIRVASPPCIPLLLITLACINTASAWLAVTHAAWWITMLRSIAQQGFKKGYYWLLTGMMEERRSYRAVSSAAKAPPIISFLVNLLPLHDAMLATTMPQLLFSYKFWSRLLGG